jgi:hypothetical protein
MHRLVFFELSRTVKRSTRSLSGGDKPFPVVASCPAVADAAPRELPRARTAAAALLLLLAPRNAVADSGRSPWKRHPPTHARTSITHQKMQAKILSVQLLGKKY